MTEPLISVEQIVCRELDMLKSKLAASEARNEKMMEALISIRNTCDWYARIHNGPVDEVHHALKVEILSVAIEALADASPGNEEAQ